MQLEKMVNSTWSDTGEEFTSKETTVLTPGQKQELLWDLEILTSGKYRAVFRAEGTNSGFDQNSLEFDVGENDLCKTDETTPTDTRLAADGNYLETHYCTGCTYAYECATAWINKNPSIVYEPNTSSDTYCVKKSYNGAC